MTLCVLFLNLFWLAASWRVCEWSRIVLIGQIHYVCYIGIIETEETVHALQAH